MRLRLEIGQRRPSRRRRVGVLSLATTLVVACGSPAPSPVADPVPVVTTGQPPWGADPTGIGNPFRERTGIATQYVRDPEGYDGYRYAATTWRSITDQIEAGWYADRGIQHLMIYGAWRSSKHFLGLPPLDFFDVQVGTGTLADLDEMTAAARSRGMGLLLYLELIYVHPDNPVFRTAAADVAAGLDSFERRLFRWDEREPRATRCPSDAGLPPAASWTSDPSIADGRCYVQSWGELAGTLPIGFPALDFERPEAMIYAKQVLSFWLDRGFDGVLFDAAHTYLGMHDPLGDPVHLARQRELHVDAVRDHVRADGTRVVGWTQDEGVFGEHGAMTTTDLIGFTHIRAQGGDDTDSYASQAVRVPATDQRTMDQLEDHWATYVDPRRQHGGGAVASLLYGDEIAVPGPVRSLDMALAGGAAGLELYFSMQHHLPTLSAEDQEAFFDVLRALAASPALAPGAARERLPTPVDDPRSYAVLRRSMDGRTAAMALFNLAAAEACVTVDVTGTGIGVPQSTVDLLTGETGPTIDGPVVSVRLPARGWRFLEVVAGPGVAWQVLDDVEPTAAWAVGDGWTRIEDRSAFGGTRVGGDAPGGSAEVTFRGRSIEGWGRMTTTGSTAVEVVIDGVSRGTHSQRRSAPIAGGAVFHGQRLFAVGDLDPGEHTLRIRALDPGGGDAGIDYLRVSDDATAPVLRPAATSTCDG